MKKLIAISAFCFSLSAFATTVLFPLQLMTGNKHNRTILIQPDISTNQIVNGTNLVGLLPVTVTPTNGVGRAALLPWSYTVRVDGWPKSFHILVPDSTNTLNAVDLITNTVAIGTPVQLLTSVAVSNSATVTWTGNGTSTNPLVATVPDVLTNGVASISLGSATPELRFPDVQYGHVFRFYVYGNTFYFSDDGSPARVTFGSFMAHGGDVQSDGGNLIALSFIGDGSNLTFTNANGARFTLIVNANTNGFTFVPVP